MSNFLNAQYSFQLHSFSWLDFSFTLRTTGRTSQLALERYKQWVKERFRRERQHIYSSHVWAGLPSLNSMQSNCIEMLICLQWKMSACFDFLPNPCHSKICTKSTDEKKKNLLNYRTMRKLPFNPNTAQCVGIIMRIDFVDNKAVCVTGMWIGCVATTQCIHIPIMI